jgi:hypothetical protein
MKKSATTQAARSGHPSAKSSTTIRNGAPSWRRSSGACAGMVCSRSRRFLFMASNLETKLRPGSCSVDHIVRHWDRMQWAVEMRSKSCKPDGMLIGVAWHKITPPAYDGEPSRPLLFRTRNHARKWCAAKTIECARHSPDWRFRPVRVREMILPNVSRQESPGDTGSTGENK